MTVWQLSLRTTMGLSYPLALERRGGSLSQEKGGRDGPGTDTCGWKRTPETFKVAHSCFPYGVMVMALSLCAICQPFVSFWHPGIPGLAQPAQPHVGSHSLLFISLSA